MKKNLNFVLLISVLMVFYLSIGTTRAQTWEATNGPFGGNVSCFTTNGSYLFAGTAMGIYGRGIFRSADNGANWTAVNSGLATTDFSKWIIAITASGSYIVASTGGGVYRSSDNGDNWVLTNFVNADGAPRFFVTIGTTLFAGTMAGIFVSTDNGLNWTARNNGWPNGLTAPSISGLVYNGTYLYAGAEWTGVFYSSDLGMTWNDINYDLPYDAIYQHKIAVKGNDVYDATEAGVWRLLNNGLTTGSWTQELDGLPMGDIAPLTMLVKDNNIYIGGNGGLYSSSTGTTGAMYWTPANGDLPVQQVHDLFLNGSDIWAGVARKGLYRSGDNSATWTLASHGMTALSTKMLTHGTGSKIWAATYEGGVFSSEDAGANWLPTVGHIQADAGPCAHGTSVFVRNGGELYRSNNQGNTWVWLSSFYQTAWAQIMCFYSKGTTLFIGSDLSLWDGQGLWYSSDNGETWSGIIIWNPAHTIKLSVRTITENGTKMFAGTDAGVYESSDNGLTWAPCNPSAPEYMTQVLVVNEDVMFAANTEAGIKRSTDAGMTWALKNNGLGSLAVKSMVFSDDGTTLYAGTGTGIYKTTDNGENWTSYNAGYPGVAPNATSLLVLDNYLYTANILVSSPVYKTALSGSVPEQPDAIVGSSTPCRGSSQTYSVTNVPGVTYAWQFPTGWVVTAGGTTNSVTVTVGTPTGFVLVTPSNSWGAGSAQMLVITQTIAIAAQPSTITGSATPTEGSSQAYSVTNVSGVTYTWTFPSGWVQTAGGTTNSVTVTVGSGAGNIVVTPSTVCGDGTTRTLAVTPAGGSKTLNLIVFFEGLYDGNGTMRQANDENGAHWPAGVADHITVELHDAASYGTIIYTASDVPLSTAGIATITVPSSHSGSYYITVKHRNSLQTVSATAKSFSGSSISQSFSSASDVFGGNVVLMAGPGTHYAIYGGDVNQDDIIDSGDAAPVDNQAALASSGYIPEDVNGDGLIDSSDAAIIDNSAAMAIGVATP
jgi:photosystem II stability/assembly factor-like uncharacterized protein